MSIHLTFVPFPFSVTFHLFGLSILELKCGSISPQVGGELGLRRRGLKERRVIALLVSLKTGITNENSKISFLFISNPVLPLPTS